MQWGSIRRREKLLDTLRVCFPPRLNIVIAHFQLYSKNEKDPHVLSTIGEMNLLNFTVKCPH